LFSDSAGIDKSLKERLMQEKEEKRRISCEAQSGVAAASTPKSVTCGYHHRAQRTIELVRRQYSGTAPCRAHKWHRDCHLRLCQPGTHQLWLINYRLSAPDVMQTTRPRAEMSTMPSNTKN
jgi:hypothetical protein